MTDQLNYELDESAEKPVETGYQRVTYYNKNLEYHENTEIAYGGFGIDIASGVSIPPFGKIEKIKHQGADGGKNTESDAMTSRTIEVAVIGVSEAYTAYWPDSDKGKQPILLPRYFQAGDKNQTRSGISLFVAFRCDPDCKVFEVPIKTFNVDSALALLSQLDAGTRALKRYFAEDKKVKVVGEFRRYALWIKLAAGDTRLVGAGKQGNCTTIQINWPKPISQMTGEDYFSLRVDPDTYKKFKALREELDTMMASGFRKPQALTDLSQLEATYRTRTSSNTERDDDSEKPKLTGGPKPFDVNKIAGGNYRIEALMNLKKDTFLTELDALIGMATRDAGYHLENALADLNMESILSVPPDMIFRDFMANILSAYSAGKMGGKVRQEPAF